MQWHHRTGPAYRGTYHTVEDDGGSLIAECYDGSDQECAKNARLIAAAPDMQKVLEWIVAAHEDVDSGADIPRHIYKEAKAALAKARCSNS